MQDGHISINLDFSNYGAAKYLVDRVLDRLEEGYKVFKIRPKVPKGHSYPYLGSLYPNTCVPIAGAIDYLRQEHECIFIASKQYSKHRMLGISGVIDPYEFGTGRAPSSAINAVWKFDPETHHKVIDSIIAEIRQTEEMSGNVVQGLELALNEVTDNIIQHSSSEPCEDEAIGYVMVQYHRSSKRIAVAVFDYGQGIPSSLRRAKRGLTLQESLSMALQRGVTGGNGAGNGLWMMSEIVSASVGQFSIASDHSRYSIIHHDREKAPYTRFSSYSPIKQGTTLIDFQLSSNREIDFNDALDGYEPTDLWYENHLDDDLDCITFRVSDESKGARSRRSAKAFSNLVLNTIKGKPEKCVIDFTGAPNMSASYADELLLSFVEKMGFTSFISRIELAHLSQFNRAIVDSCMKVRFGRK